MKRIISAVAAASATAALVVSAAAPASAAVIRNGSFICQPTQQLSISSNTMGTTYHRAWNRSGQRTHSIRLDYDFRWYHRGWTLTRLSTGSGAQFEAPLIERRAGHREFYCI
ncbi:MAG: hypothetical protein Q4G34_08015 [Micrococcus sp.]|nr:hypothetical protein [Micrococcus sp.]